MPAAASYLRAPGDTSSGAFKFDVLRIVDGRDRRDHHVRARAIPAVRVAAGTLSGDAAQQTCCHAAVRCLCFDRPNARPATFVRRGHERPPGQPPPPSPLLTRRRGRTRGMEGPDRDPPSRHARAIRGRRRRGGLWLRFSDAQPIDRGARQRGARVIVTRSKPLTVAQPDARRDPEGGRDPNRARDGIARPDPEGDAEAVAVVHVEALPLQDQVPARLGRDSGRRRRLRPVRWVRLAVCLR